jgi:hypothetical protein
MSRHEFRKIWMNELQVQETHLSTHGKQVIVPDSTHMIPFFRPDTVIVAIREVCETLRAQPPAILIRFAAPKKAAPSLSSRSPRCAGMQQGRVDGSCDGCYTILFQVGSFKPTVVLVMCDREAVKALGRGAGWLPTGWPFAGHT